MNLRIKGRDVSAVEDLYEDLKNGFVLCVGDGASGWMLPLFRACAESAAGRGGGAPRRFRPGLSACRRRATADRRRPPAHLARRAASSRVSSSPSASLSLLSPSFIRYHLLEVLSGTSLRPLGKMNKGKMQIQLMANMNIIFKYFKQTELPLVGIGPQDIVDGHEKLTLGMVWTIICFFLVKEARRHRRRRRRRRVSPCCCVCMCAFRPCSHAPTPDPAGGVRPKVCRGRATPAKEHHHHRPRARIISLPRVRRCVVSSLT